MGLRVMFSKIADRYDLVNHIFTFGLDVHWRRLAAQMCVGDVVVDLCCGTGNLLKNISKLNPPRSALVGLDFSKSMLKKAFRKIHLAKTRYREVTEISELDDLSGSNFVLGDVAHLPFRNGCVDCVGISFSLRNLTFRNPLSEVYLKEIWMVLREGGRLVTIETSQPNVYPIRLLFHLYLKKVVPLIGSLFMKCKAAYSYLGSSVVNYPPAEEVGRALKRVGFKHVKFHHVTLGVVAIHVCLK